MNPVTLLALGAVVLAGCGEPLVPPELIASNRVLGARVEASEKPAQAWPAPSESATVRWLLASPDGPPAMGWAFSLCAAETVARGLPICAAPNFVHFTGHGATANEPRFEFSMPNKRDLQGATQVAVNSAFCASGTPIFDESGVDVSTTRCPGRDEEPLFAALEISVATDGITNDNPSFESVDVTFDGVTWPNSSETDLENTVCSESDLSIPKVQADGKDHEIELNVPTSLSEPLKGVSSHSIDRETLQLSHFVTAGDLERVYSTVNFGGSKAIVNVTWTAPDSVSKDGERHRLYLVLRDGRGGVDWSRRALCIVP